VHAAAEEARLQAAPVALIAAATLVALALAGREAGWELTGGIGWWAWLVAAVPQLLLAAVLLAGLHRALRRDRRRELVVALLGLIVAMQVVAVGLLVLTLLDGDTEVTGAQLLMSAVVVWVTDIAAFGLASWELDLGGPVARVLTPRAMPDLSFPQDTDPGLARPGWAPRLPDYLYVSVTNSIAFSPTDTMPLTVRAKALMAFESVLSIVAILVVAARAVNILG
jgi:hypothetical protein